MKIDMVLMAAGESRRFGSENKLLHEIDGKSMICRAIENAVLVKNRIPDIIGDIIVVSRYDEVRKICENMLEGFCSEICYVENPNSCLGISASIHLGIENSADENSLLFMVCDQPYLKPDTIVGLAYGYVASGKLLGCVADKSGQMYNPCVFDAGWRNELSQIQGDRGGKGILKAHETEVYRYEVSDEQELLDIDE